MESLNESWSLDSPTLNITEIKDLTRVQMPAIVHMLPSFSSMLLFLWNIPLTLAVMYLMYCTLLLRVIGAMGAFLPFIPRAAAGFMFCVCSYCLYLLLCPRLTGFCQYMFCVSCCDFIWDLCNRCTARTHDVLQTINSPDTLLDTTTIHTTTLTPRARTIVSEPIELRSFVMHQPIPSGEPSQDFSYRNENPATTMYAVIND